MYPELVRKILKFLIINAAYLALIVTQMGILSIKPLSFIF